MIQFASLETEGGKRRVPSCPVAMETQQYCRRMGRCVCVDGGGCLSVGGSRLSVCRCTHHRETHISEVLHQAVTHVQCFLLFSLMVEGKGRSK